MLVNKDRVIASSPSSEKDFTIFYEKKQNLVESWSNFSDQNIRGFEKPLNIFSFFEKNKMGDLEKVKLAMLCENFYQRCKTDMKGALNETSRADIPVFLKSGLGMIVANFSEDLTGELVAQQVMPQRTGMLFFLDIAMENKKGNIDATFRMFDALRGWAGTENGSSEKIENEIAGASGTTDYNFTLEYFPVIPGSYEFTDGSIVLRDDLNGNLVGDTGTPGGGFTNTINYLTGDVSIKASTATIDTPKSSYSFNIEASDKLPSYGVTFRKIAVEARPRALQTFYGHQAVFDAQQSMQVDLEAIVSDAGMKIMMAERFKHVVNHKKKVASGGEVIYNYTQPAGISNREHIDAFGILISRLQNQIWSNTQKIRPNVCVFPTNMWFLFQYTPGFKAADMPDKADGLVGPKIAGTLTNHGIKCICDPTMAPSEAILTYRGQEITHSSTFLVDYIQFYKAPVHAIQLRKDVAMLSEYGIHTVNRDTIGKLKVTNL